MRNNRECEPMRPLGLLRGDDCQAASKSYADICFSLADKTPVWGFRQSAERPNHVWSYDFVEDHTHEGKKYRIHSIVDDFRRECLSIRVNRGLNSGDVIDVLSDPFILRGAPEQIRSDISPEFVAKAIQKWIHAIGAKTA